MFPYHWPLGLLLLDGRHGIFNRERERERAWFLLCTWIQYNLQDRHWWVCSTLGSDSQACMLPSVSVNTNGFACFSRWSAQLFLYVLFWTKHDNKVHYLLLYSCSCTPSVDLEKLKIPLTLLCSGVNSNPCRWISGLAHWSWTQSQVHVSARLIQQSLNICSVNFFVGSYILYIFFYL